MQSFEAENLGNKADNSKIASRPRLMRTLRFKSLQGHKKSLRKHNSHQ